MFLCDNSSGEHLHTALGPVLISVSVVPLKHLYMLAAPSRFEALIMGILWGEGRHSQQRVPNPSKLSNPCCLFIQNSKSSFKIWLFVKYLPLCVYKPANTLYRSCNSESFFTIINKQHCSLNNRSERSLRAVALCASIMAACTCV